MAVFQSGGNTGLMTDPRQRSDAKSREPAHKKLSHKFNVLPLYTSQKSHNFSGRKCGKERNVDFSDLALANLRIWSIELPDFPASRNVEFFENG
jgi:hypothetical protein